MYKDPDKQREANRQASKKYRDSMTGKGMTVLPSVIPSSDIPVIPKRDEQGVAERTGINLAAIGLAEAPNDIGGTKLIVKPKRGKDIKCFADLPPDVQQTIDSMNTVDGKIDQTDKAKRVAAAIYYQHLFPGSYKSIAVMAKTWLESEYMQEQKAESKINA